MKIIKQIGGNNLINGRSIQCAGACHCALEHLVTLKNSLEANEVMDHSLIPYSLALVQNFEGLLILYHCGWIYAHICTFFTCTLNETRSHSASPCPCVPSLLSAI